MQQEKKALLILYALFLSLRGSQRFAEADFIYIEEQTESATEEMSLSLSVSWLS
jgi:hypothetical protein